MNFFTILLSNDNDNTITQLVREGKKEVDVFHLNQHSDIIDKDSVFFICIGGDKTKSESWWLKNGQDETTKGFKYIASLLQRPEQYDKNDSKNYKIRIKIEYTFIKPIKKEEFIYWPDSYDTDASVATKGKQTQAIGLLREEKKYLGLLRGALYYENQLEDFYSTFFGEDLLAKIEAPVRRFVEKSLSFTEEKDLEKTNPMSEGNNASTYISNFSQIIYYGVPGSGKSHKIDEATKNLPDEQKMRVVFHPEYTNADFVGQILPVQTENGLEYPFKAGPFTRILKRALQNPGKPYYLIIEEINRGNAAAIFGDLFQLLDRGSDGWSSYSIENLDINAFIRSENERYSEKTPPKTKQVGNIEFTENTSLRLPPNLSLYATMNTSDQNVFTLDNAFQRRWDMQLVPNECNDTNQMNATITVNNQKITWKDFQQTINAVIGEKSNEGGLSSMEDKRLGCWFVKAEIKENESTISKEKFADKVLKYLWDDAFKFYHQEIFAGDIKNFEELHRRFLEEGFSVFSDVCRLGEKLQTVDTSIDSESSSE